MTPALKLFDAQLERMLVVALIADPVQHDLLTVDLTDLEDPQARTVFTAFANLRARGTSPTADLIRAEILAQHEFQDPLPTEMDRNERARHVDSWLGKLLAIPVPPDAPIATWAHSILDLADHRRSATAEAEPRPKRVPRGPRAENTEPVRLAESFRRFTFERDGEATLVRYARAWWRYNGTRYVELDDELLDRELIAFLDVVVAMVTVVDKKTNREKLELRRVTSRNKTIAEVRKALTFVMPVIAGAVPQWTAPEPDDPPADRCLVANNGILDLKTIALSSPTPRFFATTAVGCAWDPDASPPEHWLAFLASLWGTDAESILVLQQLFGYLLTSDTSQQKIFALIGPPRSGKGTIARVLKALLGDDAVVNPTLQSFERPFGLAPLVGKTLAIIGDARLGGHSDQQAVVERFLSISGEDALSIDRKNRDPVNVRLRCRVLLIANELPKLYDVSGALASRFVILTLTRSFLGSEDTELEGKLLAELPGILRWALEGREKLLEDGKFTVPASSSMAAEHLQAISSPLLVFLEECCEIAPAYEVEISTLYQRYVAWCEANGREPSNKQIFGRDLNTLHPEFAIRQARIPGGGRKRMYDGVRIA